MKLLMDRLSPNFMPCFVFTLLCASLTASLLSSGISRNFFYLSAYVSVAGLCFSYKKIKKKHLILIAPIFIFGLSKLIWAALTLGENQSISIQPYFSTGKKITLASIIILFLVSNVTKKTSLINILKATLLIAFSLSTVYAIWQHVDGSLRVEFDWNRATMSAYCYSALSLVTISFFINSLKNLRSTLLIIGAFLISYAVIIFTGTRAAMIVHPIIFIVLLICNKHYKTPLVLLLALITIFGFFYKNNLQKKIEITNSEISTYLSSDGNKLTSLGSRFSMWKEGIWFIEQEPLGASQIERNTMITGHVKKYNTNEGALQYIGVHLHNELIETSSLQGLLGGIVLLLFYIGYIYISLTKKNIMLLSCMACLIAYGITDVIFFSSEGTVFFMSLLAILTSYKSNEAD